MPSTESVPPLRFVGSPVPHRVRRGHGSGTVAREPERDEPFPTTHSRARTLLGAIAGCAAVVFAVSTFATRSADADIAWNIALNINWDGDGTGATEATFLEADGVSLNNCGGCDFALQLDIGGTETTAIAPGTTFDEDPNPLALFDMPGIVVSFAQGSYGQTFTATASGTLDEARLNLSCLVTGSAPADVFASLFELNTAGTEIVRQIARVPFPWDDCVTASSWTGKTWATDDFSWVSFAFDAPVVTGTRYAVLFTGSAIGGFQPSGDLPGVGDSNSNNTTPLVTPAPAPTPVLSGGSTPTVPTGSGVWQLADGSGVPLTVSSPTGRQIRYATDGLSVTFTGAAGTSIANGLVADANGEVVCEICTTLPAGGVIEVWMFSEPRLVAAWSIEDLPCQRFTIPVGSPLDGRGAVAAGTHTLQLALPTASGMQAVNVGVTIGRPIPIAVRAGEGPAPEPPAPPATSLIALIAAVLVGRRALAVD